MRALVERSRVGLEMTPDEFFGLPFECVDVRDSTVNKAIASAVLNALDGLFATDRNEILAALRQGGTYAITMEIAIGTIKIWFSLTPNP